MSEREVKRMTLNMLEAKALSDEGNGYIEGYAAIKGNVDSYGDIIEDGAFKALGELVKAGFMGYSHDWADAIGTIEEAREDDKGLWVRMAFHGTQKGQDVRKIVTERLAKGKSVGLSIGYFVNESRYETRDGKEVRMLSDIEVFEVSVVTMPANALAQAISAKGATISREQQFERVSADAADYLGRLADLSKSRGDDWRTERARELRSLGAKIAALADEFEATTDDEPKAETLPEGWEEDFSRVNNLLQDIKP